MERVFRDVKSLLETRPIFHQRDETIRGHVFCSFLTLVLRKALKRRLEQYGYDFEWRNIKQDLRALHRVEIEENGHIRFTVDVLSNLFFDSVPGTGKRTFQA